MIDSRYVIGAVRHSLVILALVSVSGVAHADPGDKEIGIRPSIGSAGGTPTNDVTGGELFGTYTLNNGNIVGASIGTLTGDYERLPKLLKIPGSATNEDIDGTADNTIVRGWFEQRRPISQRNAWFWRAGLGVGSVDVPNLSGTLSNGRKFDIRTDAGTEVLVFGGIGARTQLGKDWTLEYGLNLEHHFADWTSTDRVSGLSGKVDDYTTYGAFIGFSLTF